MISQTRGLKRNTIDKFYTKKEVAEKLINNIKENIKFGEKDLIVEPSAGNGAFIQPIKSITKSFLFYDIEPEDKNGEILKGDYLTFQIEDRKRYDKIHVIGNPPFGRQCSLAIKFIKKSSQFSDTISFILPKSFKKDSLKKTFPLNFHLLFETELEKNSFLVNGMEHNVPCVFQIWEKRDYNRKVQPVLKELGFQFVKKWDNPHISFRRVGVNAGKIDTDTEKSIQSHYFIKFTNGKTISENLNKLVLLNFDFNNTVGPKSISKQELISKFNLLLKD